ncbi:probable G-protein coupled receptor 21 [Amphiura filiformis]|uniref:probable G-protein coupled receptor 21 n=1 Tax=Amphiura filiformis TaxID=82378 RepID=UPI003B21D4FE
MFKYFYRSAALNMETTSMTTLGATEMTPRYHPPLWLGWLALLLMLLSTILIIVGNIIVLVVFHYTHSLKNTTSVFIKSLAFADLGVGINCMFSVHSWFAGGWPYGFILCKLVGYLIAVTVGVSILSLTGVSIDRYIAIIRPLQYHSLLTKRRARIYVITIWIMSAIIFLPSLFGWGDNNYYYNSVTYDCSMHWEDNVTFSFYLISIVVLPALAISAFCYFWILRVCIIQERKTRQYELALQQPNPDSFKRRHEKLLAKMFLIIISAFYVTWIPFVVVRIIKGTSDTELSPALLFFTGWLGLMNSFLNCFIYSICHRPFRKGCGSLALKLWGKCLAPCDRSSSRGRGGPRTSQQWIRTQQTTAADDDEDADNVKYDEDAV